MDGPLALTIRLRVKSGAKVQTSTQLDVKLLPKSGSEPHVSVRDNRDWHSVLSRYLLNIDIG